MATRRKKRSSAKKAATAACRVVRIDGSGKRKVVSRGTKAQCGRVQRELGKKFRNAVYLVEEL